jgi:hypothetical protein
MSENDSVQYRIWGSDDIAYGPVELPELVQWIQQGRVPGDAWVFRDDTREWHPGAQHAELQSVFKKAAGKAPAASPASGLQPAMLRRMKILADLTEEQIRSFLNYMEVLTFAPHKPIFKQGDHGDSMFLVLAGEVRARVLLQGRESILATFGVGECFGEVAVLDQGPRSADVVTNTDCVLVKISAKALKQLFQEAPALAAPFLLGLGRTVVGRLRTINKRYQDSVQLLRASSQ